MTMNTKAIKQLSDANSVGTVLGVNSADLIGFYGVTAGVAQVSNQNQLAVSAASAGSQMFAINTINLTPTGLSVNTAGAQVFSATGSPNVTSDYVMVNKVTFQADVGIGNSRFVTSAGGITINYVNPSGTTPTPTTENYICAAFRGSIVQTATLTPAAVAANTAVEQVFTGITGVAPGMLLSVSKPTDQAGLGIIGARVVGNQSIAINFANFTATPITPTAGESYSYLALNGLSVASAIMVVGVNVGVVTTTSVSSVTAWSIYCTNGILADDVVMSVQKPTVQNWVVVSQCFVSAANVLFMAFAGGTTTITPTANEVYKVALVRQAPVAPMTLYSVALTPAAVAPNVTVEQAFTVTGLVANQFVWVNKPTGTVGLGIAGSRVTATNVVGITYCNATTATIVPPSETYLVGHFQLFPASGHYLAQQVNAAQLSSVNLLNSVRSSLVGLNLIGGV